MRLHFSATPPSQKQVFRTCARFNAGLLLSLCACAASTGTARDSAPPAKAAPPEHSEVDQIAEILWQRILERDPGWATYLAIPGYDERLQDIGIDAQRSWDHFVDATQQRLKALDPTKLDASERINYETLRSYLTSETALRACHNQTWLIDQLNGYHVTLPQLGTFTPINTEANAAAYVQRLGAIGDLFDQHIGNLRIGLQTKHLAPQIIVQRVVKQLSAMLAKPVEDSPYLSAVARAKVPKDALRERIIAVVRDTIRPALNRYHAFLKDDYAPQARQHVGVMANPDGLACYKAQVLHHTGLSLEAQAIHEVGLRELKSLHKDMDALAKSQGHDGWRSYAEALDASAEQYLPTEEQLLEHNLALVEAAERALPRMFSNIPDVPVKVRAIEAFRAAQAPAAYYYSAPDDKSRPAYYYVNTQAPQTRPLFNMEALAYHEAVPGHHLQIATAQLIKALPDFRRHMGNSAYVEGWALYAELVADELGLYSGAATKFGMYNMQALRAARLVVDTGLHTMGWQRQKAIDFMKSSVMFPHEEIVSEIDRYIIWPGQALAYMLGRVEMQRLRALALERMGKDFDIKAFHHEMLRHGAVPLGVLAGSVERWVDGEG